MAALRGISISDLLGWAPPSAQALLPSDVASFLDELAVLDYHSMTSDESFIQFGKVQADSISLPRVTGSTKPAEAPKLTRGVYFRLLFPRAGHDAGQSVEPAPTRFVLDLVFDPIAFQMNQLTPTFHAPASGSTPAHLELPIRVRRPLLVTSSFVFSQSSNTADSTQREIHDCRMSLTPLIISGGRR